jgi:ABC-2 type transport system permease protein
MAMFSLRRFWAMLIKEFVQMRRDRLTFAMIVGVPVMQLMLFGYAINADPKNLPAAMLAAETSPFSRSLAAALANTGYFRLTDPPAGLADAEAAMQRGELQFLIHVPEDFSIKLARGERPAILVESDASDPTATGNAIAALSGLNATVFDRDLVGPLASRRATPPGYDVVIHRRYNPEGLTRYNIVPGLMGTILTMTMVMMTALAMTREHERGTMENLLSMPVRPIEVMLGKITPFIVIGYIQVTLILFLARTLFDVPMLGSLALLSVALVLFIAANLCVGFTFSTLAKNQLQALQMSIFFFLPSLLLSGFMFPFRGMPDWAQVLGEALPLTHFLRIVRGILLKGSGWPEIWPSLWPIGIFLLIASAVALKRYRQTLD